MKLTYDSTVLNLTREEAVKLHRQMWTEMREELGDDATADDREDFKHKWCREHFPDKNINNQCFLCEYVSHYCCTKRMCRRCPIDWSGLSRDAYKDYTCCADYKGEIKDSNAEIFLAAPISEILALPEREVADV